MYLHPLAVTTPLRRLGFPAGFGLLLILTAGCHQPGVRVEVAASLPAGELAGTPFDPAAETKYELYPGDRLMIRYPTDPTLDQEVRIRSDGFISLAYVGDVQAARFSPAELAHELNTRYAGVLKKADVTVIVVDEAGRRIYLGGQVRVPGALPLRANQSLSQAVIEAGGVTPQAQTEQVIVIRRSPDATYVLKANLGRILAGAEPDVRLAPFDIVHVPETVITRIDQFVDQYVNSLIPRPVIFSFDVELKKQPVHVISNQQSVSPISITRQ